MDQEDHHTQCINDNDEPMGMADALMKRGDVLRLLRRMEEADQVEREHEEELHEQEEEQQLQQDTIDILPNGRKVLRYDSYLVHQRYYDDLKHVDCHYIDYSVGGSNGHLVIEQDKTIGKGGLCWDAAFILAEHLIAHSDEWKSLSNTSNTTCLVELGSGTGLAGLMIAKAVECHARITDLPELLPLLSRNVKRNFESNHIVNVSDSTLLNDSDENQGDQSKENDEFMRELFYSGEERSAAMSNGTATVPAILEHVKSSRGTVSTSVLRWGVTEDYQQQCDVVLGADVVASLYDPLALAETMHALCHEKSVVYVSYKGRLTDPHEQFEERLGALFESVERLRPTSRNKNPEVFILKATGKK